MKQVLPAGLEGFFPTPELAVRYAELLATEGVVRGLIGPREVDRLWDRHLVNSALVARAVATGSSVADVGSGAGLPGLVIALNRPDLSVTLIEPLLRRTTFLNEVVAELGLANVTVLRARAEAVSSRFDVVTSRAVARLPQLLRWCVPLTKAGGSVLAMKGSAAAEELRESRGLFKDGALGAAELVLVKAPEGFEDVTLVRVPVLRTVEVGWGAVPDRAVTKRSRRRQ